MSKTKGREIIVYMYNVFLVSSRGTIQKHLAREIVGAQLFSSGLRETLKMFPFK